MKFIGRMDVRVPENCPAGHRQVPGWTRRTVYPSLCSGGCSPACGANCSGDAVNLQSDAQARRVRPPS